jgi:hypothetical protein
VIAFWAGFFDEKYPILDKPCQRNAYGKIILLVKESFFFFSRTHQVLFASIHTDFCLRNTMLFSFFDAKRIGDQRNTYLRK